MKLFLFWLNCKNQTEKHKKNKKIIITAELDTRYRNKKCNIAEPSDTKILSQSLGKLK